MSVIVAVSHGAGVTIGCDGRTTLGDSNIFSDKALKWLGIDGALSVGVSGSAYTHRMIESLLSVHKTAIAFCEGLRARLREEGWEPTKNEHGLAPTWDINMILVMGPFVWDVGGALYPMAVEQGTPAVTGSGYQYAMGALRMVKALGEKDTDHWEDVISKSIRVAVKFDARCGGLPWVHTLRRKDGM